ncbi:MAG: DUF3794 domain-containing protein [Firmicutes bacterium]|nr:DUF3794 domain-containing protein [Bacillota bacterium]
MSNKRNISLGHTQAVLKRIRIKQVLAEGEEQHIVRGRINIPDGLPEINKIMSTNSFLQINNTEITNGKVVLEGSITVQINYLSENDTVQQFVGNVPYQDFIDVSDAVSGMTAAVTAEVKNINLTNYDKKQKTITADITINALAKANDVGEISVVTSVPAQWRPKKEKIDLNQVLASQKIDLDKKEKIELSNMHPPVEKIIAYRLLPVVQHYNLAMGSVTINGWLQVEIDYLDLSNDKQHVQRFLPFNKLIPIPEARQQFMAEVNVISSGVQIEKTTGKKEFTADIHVELLVHVIKPECLEVVTEVNSCEVKASVSEVLTENLADVKNVEAIIHEQCFIDKNLNNYKVRDVRVGPVAIVQTNMLKEKVLLRGCAEFIVELADREDKHLKSIYRRILFKSVAVMNKALDGGRVDTLPMVEVVKCFFENGKLTISAVLHIIVRTLVFNKYCFVDQVKKIVPAINEKENAALFTYKLEKEDTMEKLADRFGTTIAAIKEANPDIDVYRLTCGCEIFIPCQAKKLK